MLDASSIFYMNKLVTGPEGVGVCDIRKPIGENIRALAKAKNKAVSEIVVAVLDRPRHEDLIREIREAGAGTRLLLDGDVAASINAASHGTRIDMCVGVGGSPEGVVTACAITAMGGLMQGILMPRDDQETQRGIDSGLKMDFVYDATELVRSDNTFFIATGVTDGGLLQGVRRKGPVIRTESMVIRGRSGTIRRIFADHHASRWA
jgi:fructose-1,6-bisphosphatase II